MTTVNYYVSVTRISDPNEVKTRISVLGTENPVWFLLEKYSSYQVDEFNKFPDNWYSGLVSLTVCSENWELRVEKEAPSSKVFVMRIIAENQAENNCTGRFRTFRYLTHYTKAIPQLQNLKLSKLIYREYFSDDPSGMPLLKHSRLCGFERE